MLLESSYRGADHDMGTVQFVLGVCTRGCGRVGMGAQFAGWMLLGGHGVGFRLSAGRLYFL